jgi:NAD(P)-dependent dehydrogenase (short-subunit alcohol dehydrogenase family)
VTCGLSGLGPVIARWLAERGAGRLALIGRRGITAESEPLVNELRERGVDVVAEALDVADDDAIRALLERLRRTGPALRGVIHSAGVLADAALAQQDAERFAQVFSPKVKGAWLLERETRGDPLDFFVLFSSIAATLGSAGQANHSAANACLDLLARQRASLGLPALSVGWGVWSDTGAAVTHGVTSRLGQTGLGTMTPAQGLAALERLLGTSTRRPAVAVLPIDWPLYVARTTNGAAPAFLSEIAALSATRRDAAVLSTDTTSAPASTQQNAVSPEAGLLERIAEAPDSRKRSVVASFVRQCAVTTLGLDASRAIEPRTPLAELGLDSLLAVELRNRLGRSLGRTFPASLLFDHPTIEALTAFLMDKVLAATEQPSPTQTRQPPSTRGGVVDAIEELSDSEVERRLAARLQSGRR